MGGMIYLKGQDRMCCDGWETSTPIGQGLKHEGSAGWRSRLSVLQLGTEGARTESSAAARSGRLKTFTRSPSRWAAHYCTFQNDAEGRSMPMSIEVKPQDQDASSSFLRAQKPTMRWWTWVGVSCLSSQTLWERLCLNTSLRDPNLRLELINN